MTPLIDYLTPLTREGVYADLLAVAADLGLSTTAWRPGEPPRGILGIFADWIATTWNDHVLPFLRCFFLDYATGDLLPIVSLTLWGVRQKGSTFASGAITAENRTGIPYTFAPGDLLAKNAEEKVFRNVTGGFLAAWSGVGAFPTLPLDFEAVELGSASTTPIGGIQAQPASAPAGVFFQPNVAALVGQDLESEAELKDRNRKATGPLSPGGPRASYEYVALSTRIPDGTEASRTVFERLLVTREGDVAVNVNRVRVITTAGDVRVILASPSGAATGDLLTAGTDVFLVNEAVQTLCVPPGIEASVEPAVELPVARTLQVLAVRDPLVTAAEVQAAVEGALARFSTTFPIGGRRLVANGPGFVLMNELEGVAKAAQASIYQVTASGGDAPVAADQVAILAITVVVTVVTQ